MRILFRIPFTIIFLAIRKYEEKKFLTFVIKEFDSKLIEKKLVFMK